MCVVGLLLLLPSPWQAITYQVERLLGRLTKFHNLLEILWTFGQAKKISQFTQNNFDFLATPLKSLQLAQILGDYVFVFESMFVFLRNVCLYLCERNSHSLWSQTQSPHPFLLRNYCRQKLGNLALLCASFFVMWIVGYSSIPHFYLLNFVDFYTGRKNKYFVACNRTHCRWLLSMKVVVLHRKKHTI